MPRDRKITRMDAESAARKDIWDFSTERRELREKFLPESYGANRGDNLTYDTEVHEKAQNLINQVDSLDERLRESGIFDYNADLKSEWLRCYSNDLEGCRKFEKILAHYEISKDLGGKPASQPFTDDDVKAAEQVIQRFYKDSPSYRDLMQIAGQNPNELMNRLGYNEQAMQIFKNGLGNVNTSMNQQSTANAYQPPPYGFEGQQSNPALFGEMSDTNPLDSHLSGIDCGHLSGGQCPSEDSEPDYSNQIQKRT
ncbi:hypothetical protein [Legionella erythra]|uniref:Uncharacterized protein n=1 Tax=Legionella erythra TaxID=448 RepID=A0A0W0TJH8_LEGER|nr:hypothetical protein [Legionella erythra]KTC95772.1 hypothetical protein Lery_2067 [Legionella erythra]